MPDAQCIGQRELYGESPEPVRQLLKLGTQEHHSPGLHRPASYAVLFTGRWTRIAHVVKARTQSLLDEKLLHFATLRLLAIDERGYLPSNPMRRTSSSNS